MATHVKRIDFFATEAGQEIIATLKSMTADTRYHTPSSYSANSELYPDNQISFLDKHKVYLRSHPKTDPMTYVANLRLMTKSRV